MSGKALCKKVTGIVMGVGTPNICNNGDKTMCAIILTDEMGFIRIYPLPAEIKFQVWSKVNLELTTTNTDPRHESWKIESHWITGKIKDPLTKRGLLDRCILKSGTIDPIDYQNEQKKSIILVKMPDEYGVEMRKQNPKSVDGITTQQGSWNKPYINWTSIQDKTHKTHLVGREVYVGLSICKDKPWNVFSNMNLNDADFDHWLLLGSIKNRMNVFVGVHVHRLKKIEDETLEFAVDELNEHQGDWPYCRQESTNTEVLDNQPELFPTYEKTQYKITT